MLANLLKTPRVFRSEICLTVYRALYIPGHLLRRRVELVRSSFLLVLGKPASFGVVIVFSLPGCALWYLNSRPRALWINSSIANDKLSWKEAFSSLRVLAAGWWVHSWEAASDWVYVRHSWQLKRVPSVGGECPGFGLTQASSRMGLSPISRVMGGEMNRSSSSDGHN